MKLHPIHSTSSAALALTLSLALASTNASAQAAASPYAGEQARSIKALSERDVAGLLEGQGAGFAKAAELNGYPGPAHTLELRDRLTLSAEQAAASEALMAAHKARARELGSALVDAERRLDALFADGRAQAPNVEQTAREVGLLGARLRAEHLNTHLAQTELLKPEQIRLYNELRGYTALQPLAPMSADPGPRSHKTHH